MCSAGVWAQTHDYMAKERDAPFLVPSVANSIYLQASVQGVRPSAKNEAPHSHRSRSPTQHPVHEHIRWLMSFETIDIPLISMKPSSDSSDGFLSLLLPQLSLKTMNRSQWDLHVHQYLSRILLTCVFECAFSGLTRFVQLLGPSIPACSSMQLSAWWVGNCWDQPWSYFLWLPFPFSSLRLSDAYSELKSQVSSAHSLHIPPQPRRALCF